MRREPSNAGRLGAALLALTTLFLTACSSRNGDAPLVGTLERDRIEIVAEESEPILSLEVREGDHVELGQVLLMQETELAGARIAQSEAQAAEARHRLTELERGARKETIAEARARVSAARAAADRDEREFTRSEELVKPRLISQSQLDQARAARNASVASAKETEAALAELLNGTRVEQLDQARSAVAAAESAKRGLVLTDARLVVRATRAGVVDALPYKAGERPPRGSPVVVLLADTPAFARVYVPEPERARVRSKMPAQILVDGFDGPMDGFVRWVARDAAFTPYFALTQRDRSRLAFLAEVEVTDPRVRELPAGVPVEVRLLLPTTDK
ncbi:MAG: HlyD family efflux transporter periplasmic adaptor subunit [Gammaproteobacteria bacterium]